MNHHALSSFIWSVADLLRGDYKQSDYGKVILPFTVLRRLDCVLEATKAAVLKEFEAKEKARLNPDPFLRRASGQSFYNASPMDMAKLMGDQDHIRENLAATFGALVVSLTRLGSRPTTRSRPSTSSHSVIDEATR
jgi:type I restriction enzyme M protein